MPMQWERYLPNWKEISLAHRTLAGWRCEWCKVPNGTYRMGVKGKPYKVVLTVAHLGTPYPDGRPGNKHDKMDVRPENLAALCQSCHLRYDLDEHIQHAKENRHRRRYTQARNAGQHEMFPIQEGTP